MLYYILTLFYVNVHKTIKITILYLFHFSKSKTWLKEDDDLGESANDPYAKSKLAVEFKSVRKMSIKIDEQLEKSKLLEKELERITFVTDIIKVENFFIIHSYEFKKRILL